MALMRQRIAELQVVDLPLLVHAGEHILCGRLSIGGELAAAELATAAPAPMHPARIVAVSSADLAFLSTIILPP